MRFRNVSCSFFKGKRSGRSLEVVKGDCTNVDGNVGKGGRFVKWEGGGRKDANVCWTFILVAGRNNMVGFEVNIIGGGGEFRDRGETAENRVKHVTELVVKFEFAVVGAFEKVVTVDVKWFATGACRW